MVSSQSSEEREKEKSPLPHPEPLTAVFQQSGSQSPDSRLVSEMSLSSSSGQWPGRGGLGGSEYPLLLFPLLAPGTIGRWLFCPGTELPL